MSASKPQKNLCQKSASKLEIASHSRTKRAPLAQLCVRISTLARGWGEVFLLTKILYYILNEAKSLCIFYNCFNPVSIIFPAYGYQHSSFYCPIWLFRVQIQHNPVCLFFQFYFPGYKRFTIIYGYAKP